MAEWGGAVEVDGLPSSASIDELSVLLSQLAHCRQHHILLSSRGTASAVAALVLLPSLSEASSVAELLDSYPSAAGCWKHGCVPIPPAGHRRTCCRWVVAVYRQPILCCQHSSACFGCAMASWRRLAP